jgi:cation diffusion facilitator CzcD-associated flavoprotein CzcO
MLDFLIVGGGIHGTHLSLYLTQRKGVPHDRLRVLDPHEAPLARWDAMVANVGMDYLRSSHAHNLHYDPFSLATFARTRQGEPLARFTDPYGRPSVELFRAHSQHLIRRSRLDSLRVIGRANGLARYGDGWRVETSSGSLETRRVILAISLTEQPYWPEWAQALRPAGAPVYHIFDPSFKRKAITDWSHAVIVGGGITAAQTALAMAAHAPVTLLMRHPVRVHAFDSDPCWVTALCLSAFHAEPDYARRRAMIQSARHAGSMPTDVAHGVQQAALTGALNRRLAAVERATLLQPIIPIVPEVLFSIPPPSPLPVHGEGDKDYRYEGARPGGRIRLHLSDGAILDSDLVIFATGFEASRPGGAWLDNAIADYGLACAPCGYPIVDKTLCWQRGLYVTGPLAELEIGPTARNIVGARLASERLASL